MRYSLLLVLGLAGCASSVAPTVTADGRQAYELRCGGLFDSKIDCNVKATEICPYGYDPIDSRTGRLTVVCASRRPGQPVR